MDKMLSRKINLLMHLARVDSKFADSERDFLESILREKGLHASYLNEHKQETVDLTEVRTMTSKPELLYWVLKLIHADNLLHPEELAYSKVIARQLDFREDVIDHFATHPLTSLGEFEEEAKKFQLST